MFELVDGYGVPEVCVKQLESFYSVHRVGEYRESEGTSSCTGVA